MSTPQPTKQDEPRPMLDDNGLPLCRPDDCPLYDGKRCRAMGARPDRFCEPELAEMAADNARTKRRADEMAAAIDAFKETVDAAERHAERPSGGQQVPFHGDFGHVPPSTRGQLRWWSRRLWESAMPAAKEETAQ
jgi:hypothetical protein